MASNSMDYILNLIANTTGFNRGVDGAKTALNALAGAVAAVGVGLGAKELIEAADQYATLQSRIKIAVGETGNFREAMAGVYQVAMQSNTSLESTANLFSRVYDTGKLMGLSQQQVLEVTKSINQAVQLSGGSAQSSEAAVTQLTQALQSGVLRGDEFNSIMEQAPTIAKTLAKELGVTTGELRNMAENGELSADRVIKAFQNQSASIQADFDKMPVTVGQALQKIQTAWMKLIGELNEDTGATNSISQFLVVISENLDALKPVIEDIKNAVGEVIERLQDTYTAERVELLKGMFTQVYDAVKSAVEAIWEIGSTIQEVFQTGLDLLSTFIFGVQESGKSIDLISVALGTINTVIGFISDGFKGITIAMNLVLGVGYKIMQWAYEFASNIPIIGKRFEAMAKQAAEKSAYYFKKTHDQAMEYQSQGVKAAEDAVKSEQQRNEEKLANGKKVLEELVAADKQALAVQEANNTRRKQLEAELAQAKADNNKVALEKIREQLAELDKSDDEFSKANIKRQEEKLKAAQDIADASIKANNGVLDAETQRNLKNLGFIAEQSEAQKKAGLVTVKALDDGKQAAEGFGLTADQAAKQAAKALGIDLEVALNQVTKGFEGAKKQVETIVVGFDELKKNGVDAAALVAAAIEELTKKAKTKADIAALKELIVKLGDDGKLSVDQVTAALVDVGAAAKKLAPDLDTAKGALQELGIDADKFSTNLSEGFQKASSNVQKVASNFEELESQGVNAQKALAASMEELLKKAKNQSEIDEIRRLYVQFGQDGKLATNDVRLGLVALEAQTKKLAPATDAVTEAMKRLGLVGREEQARAAQQMKDDYDLVERSGKATALELKDAWEKSANAQIAANGGVVDAQLASTAAAKGYTIQIGKNGQVTVDFANSAIEAQNDIVRSLTGVQSSASSVSSSYGGIGNAAVSASRTTTAAAEQAIESLDSWAAKLDAIAASEAATTVAGKKGASNLNQTGMQGYTEQQIYEKLVAAGYDNGRAKAKASELYRNTSWAATSFGFSDVPGQVGGNDLTNFNYVNQQIAALSKNQSASVSGVTNPEKVVQVNLNNGSQTVPVTLPSSQETNLINLLQQSRMVSGS